MRELKGALNLTVLEGEHQTDYTFGSHNFETGEVYVMYPDGRRLKGYLASEITEEQVSTIMPDWKTIRPYGALGVFQEMVEQQLKENGLQLRVGERPEWKDYKGSDIDHFFENIQHPWDKAVPLNQIIVET